MCVKDFIYLGTSCWNVPLLNNCFEMHEIGSILKVPLLNVSKHDRMIWKYTKDGVYSVKSWYRTYIDKVADFESLKELGDLRMLWGYSSPKSC